MATVMQTGTNICNDSEEYFKWCAEKIATPYGGYKPARQWFKDITDAHKELYQVLNGTKVIIPIVIDSIVNPLNFQKQEDLLFLLQTYVPADYWNTYNLNYKDWAYPTISNGSHKGMRWGKHLTYYLKTHHANNPNIKHDLIAQMLSKFGEAWKANQLDNVKANVIITADPVAFPLIGHYGPDNMSCFRQCSENELHKWFLAKTPNTFVVLITDPDVTNEHIMSDKIWARLWGIYDPSEHRWNICNFYPKPATNPANSLAALHKAMTTLVGNNPIILERAFDIHNVYQNNRGKPNHIVLSFLPQNVKYIEAKTYNAITFRTYGACNKCKCLIDSAKNIRSADGYVYCVECGKDFNFCYLMQAWCREPVENVYFANGKHPVSVGWIKQSILTKMFFKIPTGEILHKDIVNETCDDFHKDYKHLRGS